MTISSSYGRSLKEEFRSASCLPGLASPAANAPATVTSGVAVNEPEDLDVQSVINERRPSKLKSTVNYGHLLAKEETAGETAEQYQRPDETVKDAAPNAAGPPSGGVELRIFVDEAAGADDGHLETQDSDLVVLVESNEETISRIREKDVTNESKDQSDT